MVAGQQSLMVHPELQSFQKGGGDRCRQVSRQRDTEARWCRGYVRPVGPSMGRRGGLRRQRDR
eukprot:5910713-Pyramimonas_sp.AAC.1